MDSSFFNSFDNIDLNDVHDNFDDEIGDQSTQYEEPEKGIKETPSTIVDSNDVVVDSDQQNQPLINPQLDSICKKMIYDYSKYFSLDTSGQTAELNECIENLLTHMEEFYALIELIRSDNLNCIDQLLDTFNTKWNSCQKLFTRIDKLERMVGHVEMHVNLMEQEVIKAEEMMGKKSTIQRLFSLIKPVHNTLITTNTNQTRKTFVPPQIFKTEDLANL